MNTEEKRPTLKLSFKSVDLTKLKALTDVLEPTKEQKKEKPKKKQEELVESPALAIVTSKQEKIVQPSAAEAREEGLELIPAQQKYAPLEPQQIRELYKTVRKKFPNAFPSSLEPPKILAIGIHQDLARELKMSIKKARTFCKIYCSKKGYRDLRIKGTPRHDLNGIVVGEV